MRVSSLADAVRIAAETGFDAEYELTLTLCCMEAAPTDREKDAGRLDRLGNGMDCDDDLPEGLGVAWVDSSQGDLLVSARVSRPCRLWAAVDRGYKRPRLPDRTLGELLPTAVREREGKGDAEKKCTATIETPLFLPLLAMPYDRIAFTPSPSPSPGPPGGVDQLHVTLVMRVFADRSYVRIYGAWRPDPCAPRTLAVLGARYETRGGFLFPSEWSAGWFHGLGFQFKRKGAAPPLDPP